MRILIIEDEKSLAELVANRLKKEKYIVDISTDGEEGLYNALMDIYDLIILDIMFPSVNGIEILKEIKLTLDSNSKIKLTGNSYVSELDDEDTSYSNIDLNGYKLYVGGKELKK